MTMTLAGTYTHDGVGAYRFGREGAPAAPTPNVAPTAAFTYTVTGLTINVSASTSTDSDGTIASYSWNWGDGSAASTGATASHTYATAGARTVTLTVTDDDGATDTEAKSITTTAPSGGFVAVTDFDEEYRPAYVRANVGVGKIAPAPSLSNPADVYDDTTPSGSTNLISSSGGVYENLIFRYKVNVTGANNTFRNCIFMGMGIDPFKDSDTVLKCGDGSNTVIEHSEIYCYDAAKQNPDLVYGVNGLGVKNFKSRWNNIHHAVDPVRVNVGSGAGSNDTLMFESVCDWVHDILLLTPDLAFNGTRDDNKTHSDGFQIQSGDHGSIRYTVIDGLHSTNGSSNVIRTDTDPATKYPPVSSGGALHPQSLSCIIITNDGFDSLELLGVYLNGGEVAFNGTDGLTNSTMTDCVWKDGSPFVVQIGGGSNGYMYPRNPSGLAKSNNTLETAGTTI